MFLIREEFTVVLITSFILPSVVRAEYTTYFYSFVCVKPVTRISSPTSISCGSQNFTKLRMCCCGKCRGYSHEDEQERLNYKKISSSVTANLSTISFQNVPDTRLERPIPTQYMYFPDAFSVDLRIHSHGSHGDPWVLGYFLRCISYVVYSGKIIRNYEYWNDVEGSGHDLCYDTILAYVLRKWGKLQETSEMLAGRRTVTRIRHLSNTKHKTCPLDYDNWANGFHVHSLYILI